MKKGFISVLALAAATAAFWPAAGGASTFKGIVVAKQRGALLVASPAGALRVVHARAVVGSRLALSGSAAAIVGRASHATIRGIVVRRIGTTLILSSNHHLIAIPNRVGRRLADHGSPATTTTAPAPGAVVSTDVSIQNGQLEEDDENEVGQSNCELDLGAGDDQGRRRRLGHARRPGAVGDRAASGWADAAGVARRPDGDDQPVARERLGRRPGRRRRRRPRWRRRWRRLAPRTHPASRTAAPETGRPPRGPRSSTRSTGAPSPGSAARSFAAARRPRTRPSRRSSPRIARSSTAPTRASPRPGSRRSRGTSAGDGSARACASRCRRTTSTSVVFRGRPAAEAIRPCRPRGALARDRGAPAAAARCDPAPRVRRLVVRGARRRARRVRGRGGVPSLPRSPAAARAASHRVRVAHRCLVDRRRGAGARRWQRPRRGEGRRTRRRCGSR